MDFTKKMEDLKAQVEDLKKKADKDGDGVPDVVESGAAKARELAAAAKARLAEVKASLDKDGDGTPDALAKLGEQAKQALEQARAKAAEVTKAAQEKLQKKPSENA